MKRNLFIGLAATLVTLAWSSLSLSESLIADAIYLNGKIVTANDRFDFVQALAIKDGRIIALGPNAKVRGLAGKSTRIVDLKGNTVLPGFYDNHIHLGEAVQEWRGGLVPAASEWQRDAHSLEELLESVRRRAATTPKGQWIRGAIIREEWFNQRVPTRWDLDKVAPDHPVALVRGPHTLIANSLALEKAGINEKTPDPEGGWIFKDEQGVPNGRVLEAARRLVAKVMPTEARGQSDDEILQRYRVHLGKLAALGITSVNIAGVFPSDLRLIQALYERWGSELPRATVMLRMRPGHDAFDDMELAVKSTIAEINSLGVRTGFGNDRVKIGGIKMSVDGGLSAPVFWSTQPYKGRPDFHGSQRIPDDNFYRVAKRAHELGWQVGVHTMGDGAVQMVVNQLERILKELPRADHRHHLHHVFVLPDKAMLSKMAANKILVASQPGFTLGLGAYAAEALDMEREQHQNPTKSLLNHGIRVSYGSDGAPYGPLLTIATAVTRKGYDGKVYGPDEAISVREAIRFHTYESAYLTFDEKQRGSLEIGKVADLVVLGGDILSVPAERIPQIPVLRTVVDGREIFVSERATASVP